jgi:hypothetical protein
MTGIPRSGSGGCAALLLRLGDAPSGVQVLPFDDGCGSLGVS